MTKLSFNDLCCTTINAGLELEYEGVPHSAVARALIDIDDSYWHAARDGSLRPPERNTELKFDGPLQGKLIIQALNNLHVLDQFSDVIEPSWRCGMHVHIDYTGISYLVAHNTLILSAVLEPVLFAWGGPSRRESKFCSPTTQLAYHFAKTKGQMLAAKKYSAVNLASLTERNTVEFRYADTTLDRQRMLDFININMSLRMVSENFETGWEILDSVLAAPSCAAWIEKHLHPLAARPLLETATGLEATYPWDSIAPATALLAEHQETVPTYVVGKRHIFGR